ncbi:XRE family transcriptional regulator [Pseudohoeflea suaedae]|uniref:XRE family transcriptional regulator n=1 Tax=Pseudohoeflea suaedae TaxID=877384 RepID=A0A4R5PME4_9HYPH|nr:helix-turn-helix transcriptional regulator [Pseudohoeflea suaedae]TDH37667.1 XRE family transcriptional regulator [Pseudohoeflea suaedae]
MRKEDRADLFRTRLNQRLAASGKSRSALAREAGVDRSTIAQLLSGDDVRLPNAHLAAECAAALGVSADWLLGLSERPEPAAEVLSASFRIASARRTPADEQIIAWHQEAAGHKIRYVPATIPDLLKTEALLEWEYAAFLDKTPEQARRAMRETVEWLRAPGSDYEICVPIDMIRSLARGEGYWAGLGEDVRAAQIDFMAERCEKLYPSLRLYLYDARKVFSAPITVFGRLLAVVYVGQFYLVYRESRQVQALTEHFDILVRESEVEARNAGAIIRGFMDEDRGSRPGAQA